MGTGSLALAMVLLATGAPPSDVIPMNSRNFKIPIQVGEGQRDRIKELQLFVSSDQGIKWDQVGVAKPDTDGFKFFAPSDGLYWFNICVIDAQGKRQPPDIYKTPPREKVLVDTLKPDVRIVSAERQGDDVFVRWEIKEDHPELSTLKLEYRTPDAPAWMWYSTPVTQALSGQTSFRFINSGPVSVRLQMMDVAGNVGTDQKELVAKAVTVAAGGSAPQTNGAAPAPMQTYPPTGGPALPDMAAGAPMAPAPQPSTATAAQAPAPVSPAPSFAAAPAPPPPVLTPNRPMPGSNPEQMPPVQQTALSQPEQRISGERPWGPPTAPALTAGGYRTDGEGRFGTSVANQGTPLPQAFRPAASRWPGGPVVPLQITNSPQVTLDYEVTKVGPSGVGRVALYLTKDEGRTWELCGEDADLKPPMTANLPGEGVYGLKLVVTSRAGLGGKPPQPGDLPQMHIEVDTTPPTVKLFYPQPDSSRRDSLILAWSATDHNLAPNPITLQWSERSDGVWTTIATDLGNTGRYIWQLAPNMPYRVYLRVLARDTAGNVAVDESPEPVLIDLHEPEGQLIGISGAARRP